MAQEIDFAAPQIKTLEAWLQGSVSTMAKTVASDSGHSIDIDIKALGLKEEADIRELLPSDGMSWGLSLEESDSLFLLFCHRNPALALSKPAAEEEDLKERLGDETPFTDEEKSALEAIQDKLAQAFIQASATECEGKASPAWTDFLLASAWAGGKDPIGSDPLLVAEGEMKVGSGEADKFLILMAADLIRDKFPKALETKETEESSGGDENFLFFPASSALKDNVLAQLGTSTQECETLAELMRGFLDEGTHGAVICVGKGEEHILSLLRGIKELPNCQTKPIVVVLEDPTTINVVRCGRLGLFSVLPPEFSQDEFLARVASTSDV